MKRGGREGGTQGGREGGREGGEHPFFESQLTAGICVATSSIPTDSTLRELVKMRCVLLGLCRLRACSCR